jgi:hypothetical protein
MGEDIDLLFPHPEPGSIAVNQQERFPLSLYDIENGMAFNLNGLRR